MKNSINKMFSFIEKPKQEQKISKSLVSFLLTEEQENQITGGAEGRCVGFEIEYCLHVYKTHCDDITWSNPGDDNSTI